MQWFLPSGQLVQYGFVSTLSSTKAYVLAEKHHRLNEFDKGLRCLEKSMSSPDEVYVPQLSGQGPYLTGDEALMEATRVFLETEKGKKLKEALNSWERHLDFHVSWRCTSLRCPTFELYTRTTQFISLLDTCHPWCDPDRGEWSRRIWKVMECFQNREMPWEGIYEVCIQSINFSYWFFDRLKLGTKILDEYYSGTMSSQNMNVRQHHYGVFGGRGLVSECVGLSNVLCTNLSRIARLLWEIR